MKLTKVECEVIENSKSYQLVDEKNLIVAVVAGLSNSDNEKNATLFQNAPNMLELLDECRSAFIMLTLIDQSDVSSDMVNKIENMLKNLKNKYEKYNN